MSANNVKRVPVIDTAIEFDASSSIHATTLPAGNLTLSFVTGDRLVVKTADLSPEILAYAIMHGLKQKLVDAAAISRNTETGRPATPVDKYEAVKAVYDRIIVEGRWNATREGGGAVGGLLLKALIRLYPAKSADALREYLDGKTDAEKSALRRTPKIAAMIETIREEAGKTANIDTDELLSELED